MSNRKWNKGKPPHVGIDVLRSLFSFDSDTGILRWAVSPTARVKVGQEAGTQHDCGYKRVMVQGKNLYVHRIIFAILHGEWPEQIDHINGKRQDNRAENLRGVTNLINCHNKHVPRPTNSGSPNVYLDRRYGTYKATIYSNRSRFYLGTFKNLSEASAAVERAKIAHQSKYWPENARVPRINPDAKSEGVEG